MITQKSRITNLSTRFLGIYKNGVLVILLALLGLLLYNAVIRQKLFIASLAWSWFIWKYIQMNRKVFHVEFDDEFLYLIQKDSDILIPLQNIQDLNLKTFFGLYEIKLYHAEIVGNLIYYKPSLLYPFNFKSKDEIANVLWEKVEMAKRKPATFQKNALTS